MWFQWVLGHLTDADVVALLERCRDALRPEGAVCVKDNNALKKDCDQCGGKYLIDEENAGVIRSHAHLLDLFARAGLKPHKAEKQADFPQELFDIRMYWLVPFGGGRTRH